LGEKVHGFSNSQKPRAMQTERIFRTLAHLLTRSAAPLIVGGINHA